MENKIRKNSRVLQLARGLKLLVGSKSFNGLGLKVRVVLNSLLKKNNQKSIQKALVQKNKAVENYNQVLDYIYKYELDEENIYHISQAYTAADMPQYIVKKFDDNHWPLDSVASFTTLLNVRTRAKQLHEKTVPEWALEDKGIGHKFTDALGVKRPDSKEHITLKEIQFKAESVVKPKNAFSNTAVYLIHSENNIYDLKNETTLTSYKQLREEMQKYLDSGLVLEDDWIIEQLIYDDKENLIPARDLKFFSFYGEVVLVMEVSRYPSRKVSFWTPEGKEVFAKTKRDPHLQGKGFAKTEIELANEISRNIPAPFLRIDFLKGESGFYFSEFAPRTGTYDKFTKEYDRLFGEAYIKAENRIVNDLLKGKTFDAFMSIYDNSHVQ